MPQNGLSARARRGALDPRLLRYARTTRSFIAASVVLGLLSAALVVGQAWLLAYTVASAVDGDGLAQLHAALAALVGVVIARAALAWGTELVAGRCSAVAKRQLRGALLARVVALVPGHAGDERTGEIALLATRGIDALDGYFSLYLPQLILAVIAPLVVLAVMLARDWISAAIIVVTLPLIPVFMALVGASTRERTDAQLVALQRLAAHFLDVVAGLPTLKVFGRSRAQIDVIRDVSDRQRALTMSTLRVTFLSSLVLELLATVSVALVAVAVGLRLLNGDVGLQTALFVLVLAPEAYLPLRLLGERYHASAEGVAAAQQVFSVLETPLPDRGARADIPDLSVASVSVQSLTVRYPGRARAALDGVTFEIAPGEAVAVVGRSGAGKSTLLRALLGFVAPESGEVWVGDAALPTLSPEAWRAHVCWLPQRPHLFAASIADNIRLACPDASDADLSRAVQSSGLAGVAAERPDGLQTLLGEQGSGLSAGERQRVALARAFLRPAPLLLLDEPTANLDGATEAEVLEAVARLIKGRTVVLAAHRPALVALADRVVDLDRVVVPA